MGNSVICSLSSTAGIMALALGLTLFLDGEDDNPSYDSGTQDNSFVYKLIDKSAEFVVDKSVNAAFDMAGAVVNAVRDSQKTFIDRLCDSTWQFVVDAVIG